LSCPICRKRKPQRYCPAKLETICSVCCGTEREVTIDCPSDCTYLIASRRYEAERNDFDWSKLPFPDVKIPASFAGEHLPLINSISYVICRLAHEDREAVDSDVIAATQALAEAYRTLTSGLYYENPPASTTRRALYEGLKKAVEEFRQEEVKRFGMARTRDADLRDAMIFFSQLGARRTNGRPRGRAYLDLLRSQFKAEEFTKAGSSIIVP
jgi:hypothetical protein